MISPFRAAFAVLLALVAAGLTATPAAAHGQLAETTPADGSKTGDPVEVVTMYFTEPPALDASFEVLAPDGTKVDLGWRYGEEKRLREAVQELFLEDGVWVPRFYDVGYAAEVPVSHLPQQGKYTVNYSFTSSDDEEVEGTTTFSYSGEPTVRDANAQPLAPPSVRPPGPDPNGVGQPTVNPAVPTGASTAAAATPAATAATTDDEGSSSLPLFIGAGVVLVLGAYGGLRLVLRNKQTNAPLGRGGAATGRPAGGAAGKATGSAGRSGKGSTAGGSRTSRNAKAGTGSRRR